jgi:hypothetical protein
MAAEGRCGPQLPHFCHEEIRGAGNNLGMKAMPAEGFAIDGCPSLA